MPKTPNYRLAKIHRSYTVEEAGRLYGIHRNTVRQWIKRGLSVVTGRPVLILGHELRIFLLARREQRKRRCNVGEMYCMRCREPRTPAARMVEYQSIGPHRGRFVALCPHCASVMYRSVNPARLPSILTSMIVTLPMPPGHIAGSSQAIVNSDFNE